MILTEKQKDVLAIVKGGHILYIGGPAGSGKSSLVGEIVRAMRSARSVALTCTTGVACSNYTVAFKPMTIHKWSGVGDGRLHANQVRDLMEDVADERLKKAKDRIITCELLIIDEISMLSMKMFDLIEDVTRIRDPSHLFGNLQLVLVGDFMQLPPVRNIRYNDMGEFAFKSKFWPVHSVYLDTVFRQTDNNFITLIREVSVGEVSDHSIRLLHTLARPLPADDGEETKLYPTNILVDMYNRSCILSMAGQMFSFSSSDSGDRRALNTLVVPPTLWLKIGCRVMLLKNLSDKLVNGLQGKVMDINNNEVRVFFQSIQEMATISRCTFAVFDPRSERNVCERHQFPLKLSYGMTIHKSQGMSLDRVEVDCRHIFQPGQLGVAIGRARCVEGLRIVNFSLEAVIPQPQCIKEFLSKEGRPFLEDCSCCQTLIDHSEVELPQNPIDAIDLDDMMNAEPKDINDDMDEMDDPVFDQLLAEIGQTGTENTGVVLPDSFDMHKKLEELMYTSPVNDQQSGVNNIVVGFMNNEHCLKGFFNQQYNYCVKFYAETVVSEKGADSPVPQSQLTAFYTRWQSHMTSAEYESECLPLILICCKATKSAVYSVAFKLCTTVRQFFMSDKAAQLSYIENLKMTKRATDGVDASAKGKIRYIGGYAVAKLKYHYSQQVRSNMYNTGATGVTKFNSASKMTEYLEKMTVSEHHLLETTEDPSSLYETSRKQNINRGLTNISDQSYNFFESAVTASLNELNSRNLVKHGNSLHEHVIKTLEQNEELFSSFCNVCTGNRACNASDDIRILFRDCIYKVSSLLLKQYSRDVMDFCDIRKKMEHRKQIQVSKSKQVSQTKNINSSSTPDTAEKPGTSGVTGKLKKKAVKRKKSATGTSQKKSDTVPDEINAPSSGKSKTTLKRKRTCTSKKETVEPSDDDDDDDDDDNSCHKCGKTYNEDEDWIACDICSKWYHRRCCGLSNVKRWNYYKNVNRKFCCPECS